MRRFLQSNDFILFCFKRLLFFLFYVFYNDFRIILLSCFQSRFLIIQFTANDSSHENRTSDIFFYSFTLLWIASFIIFRIIQTCVKINVRSKTSLIKEMCVIHKVHITCRNESNNIFWWLILHRVLNS